MSATATEKATAATSGTVDELYHKAMRSYEKALRSGIQLQEELVNFWKDLLTILGSPEEFQAKFASMTADTFRQARKRMEKFAETFNRTSNQTIDLFEKNKTETGQLEKVWSVGLGFDAAVNNAKAAILAATIQSGSEDSSNAGPLPGHLGARCAAPLAGSERTEGRYMKDYHSFDEVTLHPDGTVEFWDCFINGFVRTRHPSNKQLDTLPAADAEKIRRYLKEDYAQLFQAWISP